MDKELEKIQKEVDTKLQEKHKLSKETEKKAESLWKRDEVFKFSPTFIITMGVILFILIMITYLLPINTTFHTRFDTVSKAFTISNTLLVIYVIYMSIRYNQSTQERADRAESHEISEKIYEELVDRIVDKFPESMFIYNEMEGNFAGPTEELKIKMKGKYDSDKLELINRYVTSLVIEKFEDFLDLKQYISRSSSELSWIKNFYYQFQSPIIQRHWKDISDTFAPHTNRLIEDFIIVGEYAKKEKLSEDQVDRLLEGLNYEEEK